MSETKIMRKIDDEVMNTPTGTAQPVKIDLNKKSFPKKKTIRILNH